MSSEKQTHTSLCTYQKKKGPQSPNESLLSKTKVFNEYAVTTNVEFTDKSTSTSYIFNNQPPARKKKSKCRGRNPYAKKGALQNFYKKNGQLILLVGSALLLIQLYM